MKNTHTPTAVLRHTTPPGTSLVKCANCRQWRGSDTFIMVNGKRSELCASCRERKND